MCASPLSTLLKPDRLWTRQEVLARPSPVRAERGVYAWYIRGLPAPTDPCHFVEGHPLVYLGIAPSREGSKANLRGRISQHLRGNASASTLRLSLGCLLAEPLGIELQPVRSRLHFAQGESLLNAWLDRNARVCWIAHAAPWEAEPGLIRRLDLPLNLEHNSSHAFHETLTALRRMARQKARANATVA